MSCFSVSDKHISAIIGWACRENMSAGWGSNPGRYAYSPGIEQEAFDILRQANTKSVNARYKEDHDPCGTYLTSAPRLSAIEVIKAIDCLAYQCDEWDGFEGSDAQAILRDIKQGAITRLPGYDTSKWAIE
jgi:hypothetical protein